VIARPDGKRSVSGLVTSEAGNGETSLIVESSLGSKGSRFAQLFERFYV
jgi:hypothetical protein